MNLFNSGFILFLVFMILSINFFLNPIQPVLGQVEPVGDTNQIQIDGLGEYDFITEDTRIWRAQIELKIGDKDEAETDDNVFVKLNGEHLAWLESSQDDFQRNSQLKYDLVIPFDLTIGKIEGLAIGLEGKNSDSSETDGICIEEITLWINNDAIYQRSFLQEDVFDPEFIIKCIWIDPDERLKPNFILINAEELKSSALWKNFRNQHPPTTVNSEVIEDILENWYGHGLRHFSPFEYGKLNGDEYVELRAINTTHFEVDFDLKKNIPHALDLGVEYNAIYTVYCWENSDVYGIVPVRYEVTKDSTWYADLAKIVVDFPRKPISVYSPWGDANKPPTPPPYPLLGISSVCPKDEIQRNGDIEFDFSQDGVLHFPDSDKIKPSPEDISDFIIFSDDFNRSDNFVVGNGWSETENMENFIQVENEYLSFGADNSQNSPIVSNTFPLQDSGIIVWEFTWDFSRIGPEHNYEIWLQLGNDLHSMPIGMSETLGVAVNLKSGGTSNGFTNPEGFGVIDDSGILNEIGILSGAGGLNPGGPVNFQIIMDLDSKIFDIALTGPGVIGNTEIVQSGFSFSENVNINSIRFFLDSVNEDNFGNMNLDSVQIYKPITNSPKLQKFWENLDKNKLDFQQKLYPIDFSGETENNQDIKEEKIIPAWIKKNIGQWGFGYGTDGSLKSGIQYLINNGFLQSYKSGSDGLEPQDPSQKVPYWFKNNVQWWINEKISEKEFHSSLEYLISHGIL